MKELTLMDWKSSKALYPEYSMQVSAYARAYNIAAKKRGEDQVKRLGVLRLDKETGIPDYQDVTEGDNARWRGFCGLLDYYHVVVEPEIKDLSKARFYELDGVKMPSVTTVLSVLSKPALIQWSANCCADYIRDNIEEIISPETSPDRIAQIIKKSKTAHRTEAKKATDIGSLVHDAIETYMKGGKPEAILEGSPKAQTSFLAFLEWKDKVALEPVALEIPVYHPILNYAGTPDLIGYLKKEEC